MRYANYAVANSTVEIGVSVVTANNRHQSGIFSSIISGQLYERAVWSVARRAGSVTPVRQSMRARSPQLALWSGILTAVTEIAMTNHALSASALTFNSFTFNPIIRDGQIWIAAAELAKALGYKNTDQISRTYARNEDEFSPSMTTVIKLQLTQESLKDAISPETVNLTVSENLTKPTRIFTLRGCHLIAMLSRSPIAKQFRRWVLDILDRETQQPAIPSPTISPAQQREIQKIVADRVLRSNVGEKGKGFAALYRALKDHFKIAKYDQLPADKFDEAVRFLAACPVVAHDVEPRVSITPASEPACVTLSESEAYAFYALTQVLPSFRNALMPAYEALRTLKSGYAGMIWDAFNEPLFIAASLKSATERCKPIHDAVFAYLGSHRPAITESI